MKHRRRRREPAVRSAGSSRWGARERSAATVEQMNRGAVPRVTQPARLALLLLLAFGGACGDSRSHSRSEATATSWWTSADTAGWTNIALPQPICEDCIQFTRVATLGDAQGPGFIAEEVQQVVHDRLGRFWLSQRHAVKVFDSMGVYVGEVGRGGQGPMEFAWPRPFHVDPDGFVYLYDSPNRRLSVIDEAFELVREEPLPGSVRGAVPIRDGKSYVANMWHPSAEALGFPLHLVSDGHIVQSFGAPIHETDTNDRPLTAFTSTRILAINDRDEVFGAREYQYVVEAWTSDGDRITGFRGPSLNEQTVLPGRFSADNPLPNRIFAVKADANDQMWVAQWRVKTDWLEHVEERVTPDGDVALRASEDGTWDKMFTGRLEVIDLQRGEVIARRDSEALGVAFFGDALMLAPEYLPDGTPQYAVLRVEIIQP